MADYVLTHDDVVHASLAVKLEKLAGSGSGTAVLAGEGTEGVCLTDLGALHDSILADGLVTLVSATHQGQRSHIL